MTIKRKRALLKQSPSTLEQKYSPKGHILFYVLSDFRPLYDCILISAAVTITWGEDLNEVFKEAYC